MSYYRRAVVCAICGTRIRRDRNHECAAITPPLEVGELELLAEIRGLQQPNRLHVRLRKLAGRIGTHPEGKP